MLKRPGRDVDQHLEPTLRMSRAIALLPLYAFIAEAKWVIFRCYSTQLIPLLLYS